MKIEILYVGEPRQYNGCGDFTEIHMNINIPKSQCKEFNYSGCIIRINSEGMSGSHYRGTEARVISGKNVVLNLLSVGVKNFLKAVKKINGEVFTSNSCCGLILCKKCMENPRQAVEF